MKIPISKIGEIQEKDILKSSGDVLYNGIGRICTVVKPKQNFDDRGDKSPLRMAKLFGGCWENYNNHYIIQASGCPLKCNYCYVDNLKQDIKMSTEDVVADFFSHWRQSDRCCLPEVNVLHFMGGAPGRYPRFWKELRKEMDQDGWKNKILFSDVIFLENYFYGAKPWRHLDMHHFLLTGCLKGTNRKNFFENTGKDLFNQAIKEIENYLKFDNFYISLINYDEESLEDIVKIIPKEKIDFLKIVNYKVTKQKRLEVALV